MLGSAITVMICCFQSGLISTIGRPLVSSTTSPAVVGTFGGDEVAVAVHAQAVGHAVRRAKHRHRARRRVVQRAVRGAHQELCIRLEELAGLPVKLHRHMRTSVQVGDDNATVPHSERRHRLTPEIDVETHAAASVDQRVRRTERN